jgi:serine/threonine-protein kinase HipA
MKHTNITVFINKTNSGELSYENDRYVFNYAEDAEEIVSLTMPIRKASWVSKKLHPVFDMNMPEGALREVIMNHFAKVQKMDDLALLKLIGPYMLGRVKFNRLVVEKE